jgi:preprotein translocase subunit SecG
MYGLVTGIILFICILLILIVLVQNPKGGGLAASFSSSNQFMGVKRTTDFIEKATWGFAGALLGLSIIATILPHHAVQQNQSRIQDQIENTAIDPQKLPSYPTTAPANQQQQPSDQPASQSQPSQPQPTQQPNTK